MSETDPSEEEQDHGTERSVLRAVIPGVVRRSYALKFTLALLVVVALIAGIGAASYVQIQGIIETDAENTLESTATVESDAVSEWVAGVESRTRGIATSGVYGTGDRDRIRSHLRDSQALIGDDIVSAHYVKPGRDGNEIVASTEPGSDRASIETAHPAWRDPIAAATDGSDADVVSSDRAYEQNGRLLVAFARPVRVDDGVLVVVADLRYGLDRLQGSETITTSRVLTSDGYELTAPRQPRPMALANTTAFETARDGETAIHERESDIVAFAPVDGTDWVITAEAPKTTLYEASTTVGRNVVFLVLSTIVALAIVGLVLGRGTVLPLIRLRERTRTLERGEFDVDLRTDREDEIGRLFLAFDQMRDALRAQITETEAARERAERSSRELERQNERLDQFASTVSHDLRNPLNVADGHRELLESKFVDDELTTEDLEEHVARIDEAHERMATIIDDVLSLARGSQQITSTAEIDLETIARDAWTTVDHGDARLEVNGTRRMSADRDRLRRVFENLYRNAIDHVGSDVTVTVGSTDDGFYVADDGPGIPSVIVDDAFEYGQTTAEDGTGFGLAIVKALVTAHDWTIHVDDTYDDGARFVVSGVDD